MKYKIRQCGKTQKILEMYISKEIVSEELERIYKEILKTASLPGFRAGKAPLELIKKRYKKEATGEVAKNLITDSLRKAITESDINMLGLPEISDLQLDEEKGMSYKAAVNIRPKIRLKAYKALNLKKVKGEVKEPDIDSEVKALREMNARFLTKEKNARAGDYIICDLECSVEGHAVEKKENVWLSVSDDAFIPGKELADLKSGDEKDINKLLPKDYSKKEVAGKEAKFHIAVKEVKEKILPELNDEFAVTAGNFKSMGELREAVGKNLIRRNEIEGMRALENQALKLLDKKAVFDAPEFMVERHLETLVNRTKERLKTDELSEDDIKSMEKNFRVKLKDEAVREVRVFFILDEIAKLEDIKVNGKELDSAINAIASSSGRPVDEVKKYYDENDLTENLREEIKQKKVLDFVIKNAKIE